MSFLKAKGMQNKDSKGFLEGKREDQKFFLSKIN